MSKKVVVFGGAGFLGSHVADALSDRGYEVIVFDLKESVYRRENQKMVRGNILDAKSVDAVLQDVDYVYNFSGLADLDTGVTEPIETIRLNVEGTLNILDACRHNKIKRFVFASTIYVYSEKGGFYRCSKQAAELYIEEFYRKHNVDFTILRYGTLFGPRTDERNSVFRYIKQALTTGKVTISGNGEEIREYIYAKDAARLSVDILSEEYANRHLIITGHHPIKLNQLIQTIEEMMGKKIKLECRPGTNPDHYSITPYSYIPKIGQKLTSNCYTDIGQGLLDCFQELETKIS